MPVLLVCGEADQKFAGLGRRMVDAIGGNATLALVAGTGHAPHLQRPETVADLVRSHLDGAARD
jgi:pimeloyl-ACP methyl ester carboxylesterase